MRAGRTWDVIIEVDDVDAADEDAFSWNTVRRWGCKAQCAWLYGGGCRDQCGFDASCTRDCNRRHYECNARCDRDYP